MASSAASTADALIGAALSSPPAPSFPFGAAPPAPPPASLSTFAAPIHSLSTPAIFGTSPSPFPPPSPFVRPDSGLHIHTASSAPSFDTAPSLATASTLFGAASSSAAASVAAPSNPFGATSYLGSISSSPEFTPCFSTPRFGAPYFGVGGSPAPISPFSSAVTSPFGRPATTLLGSHSVSAPAVTPPFGAHFPPARSSNFGAPFDRHLASPFEHSRRIYGLDSEADSGFSFANSRAGLPFGGWTGGALSSSPAPSLFSNSPFFGLANPSPTVGRAVDDEGAKIASVSVSDLGLKDSHEELRWRYYEERAKETTMKKSSSAAKKFITISIEDLPLIRPEFTVFSDSAQKLTLVDNVAKHSFMMGDHKVTIQIDGPVSSKIEPSLPKLRNPEYYTIPSIQELAAREQREGGYLSRVTGFIVGRNGYGSVIFPGETDVRGLDLDSIVQFNSKEVVLYPGGNAPPAGVGLNKLCVVTLLNVKYFDGRGEQIRDGPMVEKIKHMLRKTAIENGAEFLCYEAAAGVWMFAMKMNKSSGFFSPVWSS